MIVFSMFALVSLVASCFLPETLDNPAGELIYELSEQVKGGGNAGPDVTVMNLVRPQQQSVGLDQVIESDKN